MNKILFALILFSFSSLAQVGIGTLSPHFSSVLDVESSTKGFLPPRMTEEQRDDINDGVFAEGLVIYNTDEDCINFYNGSVWISLCANPTPSITGISCDGPNETAYLGSGLEINQTYTAASPGNNQKIRVKYLGGDGSTYNTQTIASTGIEGFTASLSAGTLDVGDGFVEFIITGNSMITGTASFAISFMDETPSGSCSTINVDISSDPFISADAMCEEDYTWVPHSAPRTSTPGSGYDINNIEISGDGNTMIAARPNYGPTCNSDNDKCNAISVFLKNTVGNWVEETTLSTTDFFYLADKRTRKNFAISDDGNTIVASASETIMLQNLTHAVVIFERVGNAWVNTANFIEIDLYTAFNELNISGDGNTIAMKHRIYSKTGATWTSSTPYVEVSGVGFVFDTSLSDDGKQIVYSHNSSFSTTAKSEAREREVSLYEYNESTSQWELNAVELGIPASQSPIYPLSTPISSTTPNPGNWEFILGNSQISGDGKVIVHQYSAYQGEDLWYYGFFYVHRLNETTNTWEHEYTLDLSDHGPYLENSDITVSVQDFYPTEKWGEQYDLSDDGNKLFFIHYEVFQDCSNTPPREYHNQGYISYFKHDGGTSYDLERIFAPSNLGSVSMLWGRNVSVSDNGTIVVTSNENIHGDLIGSGKIAVFD